MPESRIRAFLLVLALAALLALPVLGQGGERLDNGRDDGRAILIFPEEMQTLEDLKARHKAQLETVDEIGVRHDFEFADRLLSSGITFRHRVVEDAGRAYKAVHYDHGNGIAAADVDGDGHLDLYLMTQIGGNQLWRNQGDGTFEDVTAQAGIALRDKISVSASFADADNDGDPDLYVTTVRMGNHFFENLGDGRFRDVTEKSGLSYTGHSSGAVFFDYDRDGRLDLFLTNVGTYTTDEKGPGGYWVGMGDGFTGQLFPERFEASVLYRQTGDLVFEDVSKKVLLQDLGWSGDAVFTDLDEDGWLDLYVFNMQGDDHFYQNVGGEFFVEKGAQIFPKTPWGSMGGKFFDWNNDGRFDLFLTDMHSDMSEDIGLEREKLKSRMQWSDQFLRDGSNNIFGNAFFENRGKKGESGVEMAEISDEIGAENYWPWGVSVDDLNADGFDDLFITSSMNYPFRYGVNSVLLNERGERFHDAEFILGVEPRRDNRIIQPWFALDCSGDDKGHKHCEGREGELAVMGALGTRSAVIFDLEGDGDLDVVTNDFNSHPQVLVSDLAQRHPVRFLKVELVGQESNRDGLGAVVTVVSDQGEITKQMDGKSGYLSQSSMPLYFGLDGAKKIERVEVAWPSGATQTVPAPKWNQLLTIEEPAAEKAGEAAGEEAEGS